MSKLHVSLEDILSGGKVVSLLLLSGLLLLYGLLNLFHFFVTVGFSILFDGDLLLFSDCSSPELNFSKLLFLVLFDLFSFLFQDILIELNDFIVIDGLRVLQNVFDIHFTHFLEALVLEHLHNF